MLIDPLEKWCVSSRLRFSVATVYERYVEHNPTRPFGGIYTGRHLCKQGNITLLHCNSHCTNMNAPSTNCYHWADIVAARSFAELVMKCTLLYFSKRNHNMLPSKGNLNVEDDQLIHPALQRARDDLLRGNYMDNSSPPRVCVPVNRIEQCLAYCFKKILGAKVWFP